MQYLIKITSDLFDIAARLKRVKPTYVVYYNTKFNRYEVYDGDSFAFVVPYGELDARTVDYAQTTSVKNDVKIFAEVERNNKTVTKQLIQGAANGAVSRL